MSFTIDDREFAADRVDQTARSGTIEEWTITNTSPMDHPAERFPWFRAIFLPSRRGAAEALTPSTAGVIAVPSKESVPAPGQRPGSCWPRARLLRVAVAV
jgi:hypothetical protein